MADMTTIEDAQKIMGAMGYYPMALPQKLEPVTNKTRQVQSVNYDPQKWQVLMDALGRSTPRKSGWESAANVLAQMPQGRSFTGAYGTEVINPWTDGVATLARSFGSAYGDKLASEREAQAKDLENQIKAAQLDAEASKQQVVNTTEDTQMKVNLDPNIKSEQAKLAAQQKLAQTAYIKLNPKLGDEFRNNPDSFSYEAREADIGGRTPAGGTTGVGERALSAIMKGYVGDEALKKRSALLQEATQYVTAITDMAKQGGATGAMMNSDKEGQRAMAMFANPASYNSEELGAAADSLVNLYNRMLAVQGLPSVEQGYNQVTQMVQAQNPQTQIEQDNDPWAKYRTK